MKVTLKILLAAAVVLLVYMCYKSVTGPIEYDDQKTIRDNAIIARLIEIRKAQIEYKNMYKTHAGSFDDLEKFLNTDKLPFLIKEGVLTDEQLEKGMTEAEAVKKGLIRRDTMWVLAKDTLLGKNYDVAAMRYVPAVPGEKITFKMDTATLKSGSGYEIKVFACEVPYKEYLRDMDAQLTYNLIDKAEKQGKFPGLRVGSLEEIGRSLSFLPEFFFAHEFLTWTYKRINVICVSPEYSLVPDNYWGDGKEGHLLDFCFSTLELHCLTDILKEQQAKLVFGVDEEVYEFCSRSLLHPFFSHYMTSPLTLWTKESSASLPRQMYVVIERKRMDVACYAQGKLLFVNSYPIDQSDDIVYYILYVWKQVGMDQERDQLHCF